MGKASSAKKVARAARTGGAARRDRPKLAFPLTIFGILVLGTLLVVYARTAHEGGTSADAAPSYVKKDHWHAAYGIYVCDKFLPAVTDAKEDTLGIHTHGEGVIHIHPFSSASSGTNARMKVFGDQVNIKFTNDGFTMPDGKEYKNGYDCNGKPAKVAVYKWKVDDPTSPIEVYDSNFGNITFTGDRDAYTIAVLPEGAEPPPMPASVGELDKLTDVTAPNGATSQSLPVSGQPNISVQTPTPSDATPTPSDASGNPVTPAPNTPTPSDVTPPSSASTPPPGQ